MCIVIHMSKFEKDPGTGAGGGVVLRRSPRSPPGHSELQTSVISNHAPLKLRSACELPNPDLCSTADLKLSFQTLIFKVRVVLGSRLRSSQALPSFKLA